MLAACSSCWEKHPTHPSATPLPCADLVPASTVPFLFCECAKQFLELSWGSFSRYNCNDTAWSVLLAVEDREPLWNYFSCNVLKLCLNLLPKFVRVSRSNVGCGLMLLVPLPQQLSLQLDPTWESSTSVFVFAHTTTCQTMCELNLNPGGSSGPLMTRC